MGEALLLIDEFIQVVCIVILMINVVYEILYFTALFSVVTTHGCMSQRSSD